MGKGVKFMDNFIEFQNVTFSYDEDEENGIGETVVRNFSLQIFSTISQVLRMILWLRLFLVFRISMRRIL
jgi:hypothetical protein